MAQFTPKTVETEAERQKLMFRLKAQIPSDLLRKYIQIVKTGIPGMAYVKLDPKAEWPANLSVKLPDAMNAPTSTDAVAASTSIVVSLRDVSLFYGKTRALDAVSLDVPAGCMVGLIGPDGVGKSSLLSLIAGAHAIQSGTVAGARRRHEGCQTPDADLPADRLYAARVGEEPRPCPLCGRER